MSTQPDSLQGRAATREQRVKTLAPYRFQKGASGNPKGRKKKYISGIYERILRDKEKRDLIQTTVESMILSATKETPRMLREMADRTEGKPIGAAEDGPREIQISIANLGGTTQITVGTNSDNHE